MAKIKSRQLEGREAILVAFLAGLLGTCAIAGAILWLWNVPSMHVDAQRAEATVIRLEPVFVDMSGPRGGKSYFDHVPVVRFQDGHREVEVRVTNANHPVGKFSVGQKVSVVYRAGRPEEARIPSFFEFYLPPIFLAGLGSIFELVAAALYTANRKKSKRSAAPNGDEPEPTGES